MRDFTYTVAHTQIFKREAVLRYYFSVNISSYQGAHWRKFFVYINVFETEYSFIVLFDLYETFYYWKRRISWITAEIFRFCRFEQIFQMLHYNQRLWCFFEPEALWSDLPFGWSWLSTALYSVATFILSLPLVSLPLCSVTAFSLHFEGESWLRELQ